MSVRVLTGGSSFPPAKKCGPGGLVAIGGDLGSDRLLEAYRKGIFPWYSEDQPILWWSPDPRLIIYPHRIHVSRRMRRIIRQRRFTVSFDRAFISVITQCRERRLKNEGTWITAEMRDAYIRLHDLGYAHSAEAWTATGDLAGGVYGVALGRCFFAESMFYRISNASTFALIGLCALLRAQDFLFLDCQITNDHLIRLGGIEISRRHFLARLEKGLHYPSMPGSWQGLESGLTCAGTLLGSYPAAASSEKMSEVEQTRQEN